MFDTLVQMYSIHNLYLRSHYGNLAKMYIYMYMCVCICIYIYVCKSKYSLMFLIFVICTPIEEFVCYRQPLSFLSEVYVEHRCTCISDRVCMLAGECTSSFWTRRHFCFECLAFHPWPAHVIHNVLCRPIKICYRKTGSESLGMIK